MGYFLSLYIPLYYFYYYYIQPMHNYTGCSTRYRKRHFFNNSNTNEDIATKQTHTTDTFLFIFHTTNVLLFKFRCSIFIGVRIIKEIPDSVASGTPVYHNSICLYNIRSHMFRLSYFIIRQFYIFALLNYMNS